MTQRQLWHWAISSLAQARTHESFSTEVSQAPVNRPSLRLLAPTPMTTHAGQKKWHFEEGFGDPLPTPSMRDSKHDPYHDVRASDHYLSAYLLAWLLITVCHMSPRQLCFSRLYGCAASTKATPLGRASLKKKGKQEVLEPRVKGKTIPYMGW